MHCPYCDGCEVRDQPIAVLGTQPGAVEHALLLRQWSDDVVFLAHTNALTAGERDRLRARGIQVVYAEVTRLVVESDRLTGIELADGRGIARTAVFIRPRDVPRADGLPSALGCDTDERGFVRAEVTGRTSVSGVRAAGNLVDPRPGHRLGRRRQRGRDRPQRRPGGGGRRASSRRSPRRPGRVLDGDRSTRLRRFLGDRRHGL